MKRKVLISVLAIALVLTLCIGMFVACDPNEPTKYTVTYSLGDYDGTGTAPAAQEVEAGKTTTLPQVGVTWDDHTFLGWKAGEGETLQQGAEVEVNADITYTAQWEKSGKPKVTIYYTLGTELKSVVADVMEAEEGKYMLLQEPYYYVPDEEYDQYEAQLGKAQAYAYYYYDAAAEDHKGAAFDYSESFDANDFSIIIIIESIGEPASFINSEWMGYYTAQNLQGSEFILELSDENGGTIKLDVTGGMGDPIVQSIGTQQPSVENSMIFMSSNGQSLILLEESFFGDSYNYYYITKNADGTMTVSFEGGSYVFSSAEKPGPKVTATVYYLLNGELKSAPAAVNASGDAFEITDMPENSILESDLDTFMEAYKFGTKLKYYHYDADKTDHKGEEFDPMDTFTESVSIYIAIEAFATPAESIDSKYDGTFTGTCTPWGDFTLTINAAEGTTNLTYLDDGETIPSPINASIKDGTILIETDGGRLMFVEGSTAKYAHYYYIKEASGALTLDSDYYQNVALKKQGGEVDPSPTPEQGNIYVGSATVDEASQSIITKIEFDDFKEPTQVTVTYDKGEDKNQTVTVYLSNDTPEKITNGPEGTVKHGYCSLRVGAVLNPVFNFGIGIYEDGTVVITDKSGKYIATFTEDKGGATTIEFADIIGGYKATGGGIIYTSKVLSDDTYLGSLLYDGELIPILSFTAAADGSYTLFGIRSDKTTELTATYKAADKSITIGTDAYTLDEEAPTASFSDFAGYWERSDNQQYWSIQLLNVTYTHDAKKADCEIIGDYIYLFYQPTGSSTYYYLLQLHTEDDVKTLVGTYVEPEKAPKTGITFNATQQYVDKTNLYTFKGDVTSTMNTGLKIHITQLVINSLTNPTYAEVMMGFNDAEVTKYEFIADNNTFKSYSYQNKYPEGKTFKISQSANPQQTAQFVFVLVDDNTIDIYNYDSDEKDGTLTTGGGEEEPEPTEGTVYVGSATIPGKISGSVTAVKIEIDNLDAPKKFTITLDDETVWEITDFDDDTQYATGAKNLKGAYSFEYSQSISKNYGATIAILNDGSIAIYTGYQCDELVNGGDSFHKEGEEQPTHAPIPEGTYVIEGTSKHTIVIMADWKFDFCAGGSTISPYHGTYSWDATANAFKGEDNENEPDTFTITINEDGSLQIVCTYGTWSGKYTLKEEEEKPPVEHEDVTYTGSIKIENYYSSWTLVEIKFDKADVLNTLYFKVSGKEEAIKATCSNAEENGYTGFLALFKLDDGSLADTRGGQYPQIVIKYGNDEGTLIVADATSSSYTNPTEFGTLTKQGSATEPAKTVKITVNAGEHGTGSYVFELPLDGKEHKYSEILTAIEATFKGENKYYYLTGRFTVSGSSKGRNDTIELTEATTITALFDDTWDVQKSAQDEYPKFEDMHLGSTSGSSEFWKSDSVWNGTSFTYTFDIEAGTIEITIGEEKFNGTIGEYVTNDYTGHILIINITITVSDTTYTFGTGSPQA